MVTTANAAKSLKDFFSVDHKAVSVGELREFRQADPKGYDELVKLVVKGHTVKPKGKA